MDDGTTLTGVAPLQSSGMRTDVASAFCNASDDANYCLTASNDAFSRKRYLVTCKGGDLYELKSCGSASGCALSDGSKFNCIQ
jgi:hypothetical protein